ncbi:non-ribosomal peptide synthetase [Winogradskyella sp. 4-2091]|uniref:non-ribosomal peptide synthetase n=1 Tax=Winogradskyella sp. 4-2091 TaxID=3381659 RepID=UPI00389183DE
MNSEINYIETNIALTQSQLMLWVGQKLNPESPMYNMAHSFEISGKLDVRIFKQSFNDLIANLDVFRITFSEDKGIPSQNVLANFQYDLEIVEFLNRSTLDLEKELQNRTMQVFDTSQPLFNSVLYKLDTAKYVWFLNMHHLVTDATSSTVLFDNFSKLYQQHLNSENESLPEIPQFRDYLKFEAIITHDKEKDDIRNYWKETAKKVTAAPILYGQKNKESTSSSTRVSVSLGKDRIAKLEQLVSLPEFRCWTKDLTYFNIFLTALFVYIKRVSNEEKLAIGALSHSRVTNAFKKTAGMFVELFPLVAEFSTDDTFLTFYNKVRNETNNYLRNAQPGMATTEASSGFNVVLNYIKASFSDFNGNSVTSKWIHPNHCDAAHHMRCTVYDMDGTGDIELLFDLNTAVFNSEMQKNTPSHFLKILDAFLEDNSQLIDVPSMISKESIKEELDMVAFNNSYPSFINKITDVIENYSDKIAIRDKSETYTYNDLNRLSNALCFTLKNKGIKAGDRVGLHMYRSADYVISLLALMKSHVTCVPIAADQAKERIKTILEDSECKLVVTTSSLKKNLKDSAIEVFDISDKSWTDNKSNTTFTLQKFNPNEIAYILYTSGSTGKPKGIKIKEQSVSNYLQSCNNFWGAQTKFAFCTSISFDITYTAILLPLYQGGEIIVYKEDEEGPDGSVLRMLEDNRADSIVLTPSHLLLFIGKGNANCSLRNIIVLGEDFKTDLANKIKEEYHKDTSIYNFYGPAEATIACVISKFNSEKHKGVSVPIGKPIANTIALVLDDYLNPVPKGVVGTLFIGGHGIADGYVKRPNLTAELFITNPFLNTDRLYNTGDLVRLNSDNEFEFLGRKDSQVKLNGHRIELREIECVLEQIDGIIEAVTLVIEKDDGGLNKNAQLVAFYRGDYELEVSQIQNYLVRKLPSYMIPLQFKYLHHFPLTTSAKTDRKKLKDENNIGFKSNEAYIAPTNEIEEIVANVWSELLHIEKIGIYDNFIALGGHSLLAMRITSALNEILEMENPLDKIFVYPTVASYATYVEETIISLLAE